jgi:molecular chaperone GrpE
METVGKPFNPEFHQAIMQVESDEHEEGIVVEEVQKGYMLKDKVLRPAMVKVSS